MGASPKADFYLPLLAIAKNETWKKLQLQPRENGRGEAEAETTFDVCLSLKVASKSHLLGWNPC
jgi:hypothetical protein